MNFRSSGVATGLLAVVVTGCATAPASSPGPGAHPTGSAASQKNEAEPAFPLPKTYPLHACAPQRRFSVTVIVVTR